MIKPSTNSKDKMPIIKKADGKYCWDANGNRYLDFTGANLTVIHGYRPRKAVVPNFPGVSSADGKLTKILQEETGKTYFRYFTNGSSAVDCAVRLARLSQGNNAKLMYIGYGGAHDSYAKTINSNGIPSQKTYQYRFNQKNPTKTDILVFESRYAHIADMIDCKVRVCDCLKDGILALYKEMPKAQLYTFGKSVGNGSPIAILTGKNTFMLGLDDIYYSQTFGCNNDMMIEAIRTIKDFEKVKDKYFELYNYAKEVLPPWFSATPKQVKEFMKRGVLFNGYWQIFTIHTKKDIMKLSRLCDKLL